MAVKSDLALKPPATVFSLIRSSKIHFADTIEQEVVPMIARMLALSHRCDFVHLKHGFHDSLSLLGILILQHFA
jgi:hypothetical protein